MNYQKKIDVVKNFFKNEGQRVLKQWHSMKIFKHDDLVDVSTNFDKEIEKNFSNLVNKEFSKCGFQGEEYQNLNRDGEYKWQIDPIDGSKFFASMIPMWTMTAALVKDNEALMSIIYNPVADMMYHAIKGKGAFLNDKQIYLKKETDISKLQVSFDLSKARFKWGNLFDEATDIFRVLEKNFYRVRSLGSGATSLAWLAQGFFGAFFDFARLDEKIVDVSGGFLIAKEAGAQIWSTELGHNLTRNIVAKSEVIKQIKNLFGY